MEVATEGTIYGDQNHAPNGDAEVRTSGCWNLLEKYCKNKIRRLDVRKNSVLIFQKQIGNLPQSPPWMIRLFLILRTSAREIHEAVMCVTGGIVSCQDSKWLLSWTINRQGQFKETG